MKNLISEEYKSLIVERHYKTKWGGAAEHKQKFIKECADKYGVKSILDYGAGFGQFKDLMNKDYPGQFEIHEYEPGIIGKDKDPAVCDMTISLDVLEHIEPDKIDNVLQHIYDKTNKIAFHNICCVPAHGSFPNGQNFHLLVKHPNWWLEKFKDKWNIIESTSGGKDRFLRIVLEKK
jgi:hypothetical protein